MEFRYPDRRFVRESRPYDFIYDHVYTTSTGPRSLNNEVESGSRGTAEIKYRPIYKSMFTQNSYRTPNIQTCLKDKTEGIIDNFRIDPSECYGPEIRPVDPSGADRAIFAMCYSSEGVYKEGRVVEGGEWSIRNEIHRMKKRGSESSLGGGFMVSRGVQSDYRESETQTDPYSPPYILPHPDAYPKVLALIHLTWGKGLPVTLDDIVLIERALAKRLTDMNKIDIDDVEEFVKKTKAMGELEAQHWADREMELSNVMNEKLKIMNKIKEEFLNRMAQNETQKLLKVLDEEKVKSLKALEHIRNKYRRELQYLQKKYCKDPFEDKNYNKELIMDFYYKGGYYPKEVFGFKKAKKQIYDSQVFTNINVFKDLTSSECFKKNHMEFNCQAFTRQIQKTHLTGRERRMERNLEEAFTIFKNEALKKGVKKDEAAVMQAVLSDKNQRATFATPILRGPPIEQEMEDNSVILLQKIIRGKAVQTMMIDEIRANNSTLQDMKALHKMDPNGVKATMAEILNIKKIQTERENQIEKQNEVTEITEQLEGEAIGRQLEFLEKEMIRLIDERKIHALITLAERERRMKEAIEAGRRQAEVDSRRVNDEIFRQIVGVNQATVDLYLEDLFLGAISRTADDSARTYVQNLSKVLNEASSMFENGTEESSEVSADIVHSFLMPEINRIYQRQKLDNLMSRFNIASQQVSNATFTAQGVIGEIVNNMGTIVKEGLEKGVSAVDGAQLELDEIIRSAVNQALNLPQEQKGIRDISLLKDPVPLEVPCLKEELAIKSVQVEQNAEVGIKGYNLFAGVKNFECQIFDETLKAVKKCLKMAGQLDEDEVKDVESEDDNEMT